MCFCPDESCDVTSCSRLLSVGAAVGGRQHRPRHTRFHLVAAGYSPRSRPHDLRPLARPPGPAPALLPRGHRPAPGLLPGNDQHRRQRFLQVLTDTLSSLMFFTVESFRVVDSQETSTGFTRN